MHTGHTTLIELVEKYTKRNKTNLERKFKILNVFVGVKRKRTHTRKTEDSSLFVFFLLLFRMFSSSIFIDQYADRENVTMATSHLLRLKRFSM